MKQRDKNIATLHREAHREIANVPANAGRRREKSLLVQITVASRWFQGLSAVIWKADQRPLVNAAGTLSPTLLDPAGCGAEHERNAAYAPQFKEYP